VDCNILFAQLLCYFGRVDEVATTEYNLIQCKLVLLQSQLM
jgi:hypothetical protein